MRTTLLIATILISTITFAQSKSQQFSSPKQSNNAIYVKIGDIKGESNKDSSKRTIKIGGTEKPYARSKKDNNQNSYRFYQKRKLNDELLKPKLTTQRRRANVKLNDIKIETRRRRVIIAKSNKQGDPNVN